MKSLTENLYLKTILKGLEVVGLIFAMILVVNGLFKG